MPSKKPTNKTAKKAAKKPATKKAAKKKTAKTVDPNPEATSDATVVVDDVISLLESATGQDSLSNEEIQNAVAKLKLLGGDGDHKTRARLERAALESRVIKLDSLLANSAKMVALGINNAEVERLRSQRLHMGRYLHVLNIRIANFNS